MKSIKNYQQAKEFLGVKKERPYAHNTRIEIDSLNLGHEVITVKYHGNPVVEMFPNGTNYYNSCGWRTFTTKERINWFLPDGFTLHQEKSIWFIARRHWGVYGIVEDSKWIFADGIAIDSSGNVYNDAPADEQEKVKKTIKRIKKYVDGYIKALFNGEVGKPDAGDCFFCYMHTEDGQTLGDKTSNDHIESHIEESYFVPSLLVNAHEFNHRLSQFALSTVAQLWENESVSDWQVDITSQQVKACLTDYLKHELDIAQ